MVALGRIPSEAQAFLRGLSKHFARPAWDRFWALVLAMLISHGSTIDRLARWLRGPTHRRNHGGFLWRSGWAYDCLTHPGLEVRRAQGHRENDKVLRLPPISRLKGLMRQAVRQEAVEDVLRHRHEKPVIRRPEKLLAA